jgi:hypothetical protein
MNLDLVFTPEPTGLAMGTVAAATLLLPRRRARRTGSRTGR